MPKPSDFPATGCILSADSNNVVFQPQGTNYQLRLRTATPHAGPVNQRVSAFIRAKAGKLYTVPSGGNFVVPIFGPPRTIQGQIRYLDETTMVVQAGTPVVVELPRDDEAYALAEGALASGKMVNVVAMPEATLEIV